MISHQNNLHHLAYILTKFVLILPHDKQENKIASALPTEDLNKFVLQLLTRSYSSTTTVQSGGGAPEGGTLGRRPRSLTRSSLHQTGTQSAYSSRDASPEKGYRFRKLSPYPAPPPSIMIAPTPPRTPRR